MSKTVVVYHSGYGHTQRVAQFVAEGAKAQQIAIDADGNITDADQVNSILLAGRADRAPGTGSLGVRERRLPAGASARRSARAGRRGTARSTTRPRNRHCHR